MNSPYYSKFNQNSNKESVNDTSSKEKILKVKKVANIQKFLDIDSGHCWTINLNSDYRVMFKLSEELEIKGRQIFYDNQL